jgi:GNAT superfamily N-acetyltransferase
VTASPPPIAVARIAAHPGCVSPLADAFAREWPDWAAHTPRSEIERGFEEGMRGELPCVWVALDGALPVGTIALRPWFAEAPMPQTPWIRGLWVLPAYRGRGVDRRLIAVAESAARQLGHGVLYAATTRIERLARRRGWEVFHRLEHDGAEMAWMRRSLP